MENKSQLTWVVTVYQSSGEQNWHHDEKHDYPYTIAFQE